MSSADDLMEIVMTAPNLGECTRQLQAYAETNNMTAAEIWAAVEQAKGYASGTADRDRRESFLNDQRVADKSISGLLDSRKQIEALDHDEAVQAILAQRR